MNNVRSINKINERELELALQGASWHDEYKDSAYIFVGGLPRELTEGDVITIFSQYGEILDINLPREKDDRSKRRGFGFLMFEDQRSTVLAVDNLNGANILGRTIRVDHVREYRHPGEKGTDGEWHEPEKPSMNAAPPIIEDEGSSEEEDDADLEDPMASYISQSRKEEKEAKRKRKEERTRKREERRLRKETRGRNEHPQIGRHGPDDDRYQDRYRKRSRPEQDRHSHDSKGIYSRSRSPGYEHGSDGKYGPSHSRQRVDPKSEPWQRSISSNVNHHVDNHHTGNDLERWHDNQRSRHDHRDKTNGYDRSYYRRDKWY